LFVAVPPAYQAAATVLIANNPNLDPSSQMQGDVALAQAPQVAASALRRAGLHESLTRFTHSYTVSASTDRLLQITANASAVSEAERRANAVAAAFMQYRAELLQIGQQLEAPTLNQQIAAMNHKLAFNAKQITAASALPKSARRDTQLKGLLTGRRTLDAEIGALKYEAANNPLVTVSMIKGTAVLDAAAPIPPSRKHIALMTGVAGLVVGLALGLGVVMVDTATSDRLRRRRDIARALGAPIKLTIDEVHSGGWLPGRPRLIARRAGDMPRLVAHLRSNVREVDGGEAALAVVPVGNADVVAQAMVRLATSCASQGRRVLLADLAAGAPAARLLRTSDPGVHFAGADRERIAVAVPERSDRVPVGPVRTASQHVPRVRPGRALAAVHASADLLLTVASLDPMHGAEHLTTWTTDVVVVVTAGRSAAPSLKATGEMIRLAGLRLVSVVLLGADNADDSLGTTPVPAYWRRRPLASRSRQSVSA
jgi:capsular polysaccharide biosynthesis protein